jgi:hypothetical protein
MQESRPVRARQHYSSACLCLDSGVPSMLRPERSAGGLSSGAQAVRRI